MQVDWHLLTYDQCVKTVIIMVQVYICACMYTILHNHCDKQMHNYGCKLQQKL